MLDSIYHMTLKKITLKSQFWHENVKILLYFTQCYDGCHYVTFLNL